MHLYKQQGSSLTSGSHLKNKIAVKRNLSRFDSIASGISTNHINSGAENVPKVTSRLDTGAPVRLLAKYIYTYTKPKVKFIKKENKPSVEKQRQTTSLDQTKINVTKILIIII